MFTSNPYKITEINDLGKIAVGEIDTFKALHPEAKLEDAIKFAQDKTDRWLVPGLA